MSAAAANRAGTPRASLLDRLQAAQLLPHDERVVVETEHRLTGTPLETLLFDYGFADADTLQAMRIGMEQVRIQGADFVPDAGAVALLDERFARRFRVLPLAFEAAKNRLTLVLPDADDLPLRDRLQRLFSGTARAAAASEAAANEGTGNAAGASIVPELQYVIGAGDEIAVALDRCYGASLDLDAILDELVEARIVEALTSDSYQLPIVRLIDAIVHDAVSRRASDIHLNPEEGYVRIRYRVDGVLVSVRCLHHRFWPAMVVRVKVLSDMDITETRSPQDGQFSKRIHGRRVHLRVSSFPLRTGENLVLRVLDQRQANRRLHEMALPRRQLSQLMRIVHQPRGLIVVAGPTGSGKSTTLQGLLGERDSEALNVMTLEEPVEHPMLGVRQASVNTSRKLDFASGVRGLLRQDPDVLLIGEVRDPDSCAMAFRASMSGHQVLTTVHADDTVSALFRLQELGVTPAVQAATLSAIVSQRLLRRRCTHCSAAEPRRSAEAKGRALPSESSGMAAPALCHFCHGSGYHGRQVCMEILEFTQALRRCLVSGAEPEAVRRQAHADGLIDLHSAAMSLVNAGVTTGQERDRVLGIQHE